jgi:hypothetical protein
MSEAMSPKSSTVLGIAIPCGALIGLLTYITAQFPWWLLNALEDTAEGGIVVPFLKGASVDVLVACVLGALAGGIVFGLLLKRQSRVIWRLGCPLVALLLSFAGVFTYTFVTWYIDVRYVLPPDEFTTLVDGVMASLIATIPSLVCLTPLGLVAGVFLQTATKNLHRK